MQPLPNRPRARASRAACLGFARLFAPTLWVAAPLAAQFPGDVFFATPAVSVPEGEPATLAVQAFTGSQPLGAYLIAVEFDPAQLAVQAIERPDTVEVGAFATAARADQPGQVRLAAPTADPRRDRSAPSISAG